MNISDTEESLILNIILMFIAIFSIWNEIYKKESPGNFLKKITRGGYLFMFCTILFVWVNYIRDSNNAVKVQKAERNRDSVNRKLVSSTERLRISQNKFSNLQVTMKDTILSHVEASNTRIIKATNTALAKYNLVFIDSLKTIKPINRAQIAFLAGGEKPPEIYLTKDSNSAILHFKIKSVNNIAYNIILNYCIFSTNLNDIFHSNLQSASKLQLLDTSNENTKFNHYMFVPGNFNTVDIPIDEKWLNLKCLIFIYGSFSYDDAGKERKFFSEGVIYDFTKRKSLGMLTPPGKLVIIGLLKKMGKIIE